MAICTAKKKTSKKLKEQLAIWYAKHPLSKRRTTTKSSGCTADDSDEDLRSQRSRVYNDSASDDDDKNTDSHANAGGGSGGADMDGCND
jgi:hypothetical protein